MRRLAWADDLRQDAWHSLRLLRNAPVFTLTATLSLAIGIGANAAIFTIANTLLLRPPDGVAAPARLVDIGLRRGDGGINPMPYATYLEIKGRTTTLASTFAQHMFPTAMSLSPAVSGGAAERVFVHFVSTDFFTTLGATPSAGRLLDAREGDERTMEAHAVLSHAFWIARYNRSSTVIGQILNINGRPFTVVGVAAAGFQGTGVIATDLWLPLGADGRAPGDVVAGGRLKDAVSLDQSAAELAAIGTVPDRGRSTTQRTSTVHVLPSSRAAGNRMIVIGFTGLFMAIVSLVLAAACANVAGIVLARADARRREMALRTALGAGRGRLVRQLLTETLTIFALGGLLGLALAKVLVLLPSSLPALPVPLTMPLVLDWRVVVFTALLSLAAALASGVAPAFRASSADSSDALKEGAVSVGGHSRLRNGFVVGQVAVSLLLVVMAGLFVRALRYAGASNPGFEPAGVEIAVLDLPASTYDDSTRAAFWMRVLESVRQLTDVETAALARVPPGGFEGIGLGTIAGVGSSVEPFAPGWNIVSPGYFETLHIQLLAGRDFTDADDASAQTVAIVGEGTARRLWPGANPIGRSVMMSTFETRQAVRRTTAVVVGVVRDVKSSSLIDGLADSYVYVPLHQHARSLMTRQMAIVARSRQGVRIEAALRKLVSSVDPNLAVMRSETLEESMALGLAPQRMLASVAGSLGVVGLLLAVVGIYGVTAYMVARRSRELGIRIALGAQRHQIASIVLTQGIRLSVCGILVGLFLAAGVSQVLSVFLYGLPPFHMPTFLGAATLFVLVGLAASYIPARRAISVDPLTALRRE